MNYFHELQKTLASVDPSPLLDFVRACEGTLWLAGNGGSASTAQHWACDLSKAANRRVQALGSNPAILTAWANDVGYEHALVAELLMCKHGGDALIVFSCSGASRNIANVLRQAKALYMPTALLTSLLPPSGVADLADLIIRVPHTHYGIIEDCHLAIGHWLTEELQK